MQKEKEGKGNGVNYTIQIKKGQEIGSAVLKTWEKNSKKEYKMVVSKPKGSDVSFVRIFGDVIKVLLDRSISGEGWSKMKSQNIVAF